jgi:hypothetical protein
MKYKQVMEYIKGEQKMKDPSKFLINCAEHNVGGWTILKWILER